MKRRYKILFAFTGLIAFIVLLYSTYAYILSFQLNKLIDTALNLSEYSGEISDMISQDDYERMFPLPIDQYDDIMQKCPSAEISDCEHTFPLVFPFCNIVEYHYTYIIRDPKSGEELYLDANGRMVLIIDYSFLKVSVKEVLFYPY